MSKHGITPCGHRLLILPDNVETTTKSGIITSTGTQVLRDELAQIDGTVIAIGPDCNGWCTLGDRIIFGKYSGLFYTGKDKIKYRIVNDDDVVAVVQKGDSNE